LHIPGNGSGTYGCWFCNCL